MAVLHFLAWTGMGAAMFNASTPLAEYSPLRRRSLMITAMFTGFNLGSTLIGFAAAYLIPFNGWQSVMVLGGVVPLALVPLLLQFLPRPVRLMVLRGAAQQRIAQVLGRARARAEP